jgi:hypothetical protein
MAMLMILSLLVAPSVAAGTSPAESEDVPVPGGTATLAKAIGLDVVPDRARFAAELARVVYGESKERRKDAGSRFRRLIAYFETVVRRESVSPRGQAIFTASSIERVPVPLPAAVWSGVLRRHVGPADLFAAVMSDENAALLVHGLAAMDDETLRFFVDHPALVRQLYEDGAPAFATFGARLGVRRGRIAPPGGEAAAALWEARVDEKTEQPARFIRRLFTKDGGRLAYLYDAIGSLDSARASFALGLWIPNPQTRLDRFNRLDAAMVSFAPEWSIDRLPFRRPSHDLVSMLLRIQPEATGAPSAPMRRALWARVFDVAGETGNGNTALAGQDDLPVDAAWLVEALLHGDGPSRSERLDQLAFAQRALDLAGPNALANALLVLRAFPRFRMLMLTLERIGVRRPALYAALIRHAEWVSGLHASRAHAALAGFQGSIALVERLTRVRTIDSATAERLLEALAIVGSQGTRGYRGALVPWLQLQLGPILGESDGGVDDGVLDALAGRSDASTELLSWEGQRYRFDLVTAERRRLRGGRPHDGRHSIDSAIALYALAQRLATTDTTVWTDIQAALVSLRQRATWPSAASDTVEHAIASLTPRSGAPAPSHRMQARESLLDLVDVELGEALLALGYEINLSVPRGAAGTAGPLAGRHDFGLARSDPEKRVRAAWSIPRRAIHGGVAWRIEGAALGLELAIPSVLLRRIDTTLPPRPQAIREIERDAFAAGVALMDARLLRQDDLEAIAAAMARGRRRVEALARGDGDANALAREIGMDGWRMRALQWTIRHEPARTSSWFSETDLLFLGGGDRIDLTAWGMPAGDVIGCICSRLTAPGLWSALVGRPQPGVLIATVADLNLRVADVLAELGLPAGLARSVLSFAVQDFVDRVPVLHADDWLTRVRAAQALSREQIEDYVSAVTVEGPLVADTTADVEGGRVP